MLKLPKIGDKVEVVILADGDFPSGEVALSLLRGADKVVCCDAAVRNIENPYAIVGDCDSITDELRFRHKTLVYEDSDQMTNDLTKSVEFCVQRGFKSVVILGATGKREDHTLGNISLLAEYAQKIEVRMVTDYGVFDAVEGDSSFESFKAEQVSIFAIDPRTEIFYRNLKYPIMERRFASWWCGTLNESLGDSFDIVSNGMVIVYRVL